MRALPDRIAVVGLGVSGVAAARHILAHKAAETVLDLYDAADNVRLAAIAEELRSAGARVFLGVDVVSEEYDLAIVSPGIPPASALRRSVSDRAARMIGEIEFAFERSAVPWLGVTGTNGKTTTTSLCAHLLNDAGVPAEPVGNIGNPPIALVDEVGPSTAFVAELSSFQLALTEDFRPRVAVLLNITPDHIDWHGSLEAYAEDKARLFANMTVDDCAVIDIDDAGSRPYADIVEARGVRVVRVSREGLPAGGAGLVDGWLVLDTPAGPVRIIAAADLRIRGDHNVSNALAAAAAAHAWGVEFEAIADGLATFEPIEHRLEPVATVAGVEYVNDSKATNPGATLMALTAFGTRPVVLLLGGRNKDNPFDEVGRAAAPVARSIIVFGEAAPDIERGLTEAGVAYRTSPTMLEAVELASQVAEPGDVVLLSPACASFDEFEGYAHRGRVFKSAVRRLAEERAQ